MAIDGENIVIAQKNAPGDFDLKRRVSIGNTGDLARGIRILSYLPAEARYRRTKTGGLLFFIDPFINQLWWIIDGENAGATSFSEMEQKIAQKGNKCLEGARVGGPLGFRWIDD